MRCLDLGFWIAVGNICHSHIVGVEDDNIWSVFSSTENGKTKEGGNEESNHFIL
jgi:hypothetical protein